MTDSQQVRGSRSSQDGAGRPDTLQDRVEPDHDNHGQSVASWTCVGLIMTGALVMAISVVLGTVWLFVVGAVIVVAGAVSGKVLSAMGFGVSGRPGH